MKIAILTSLWDRPDVEEITVDYYAWLRDAYRLPLVLTAAYSEETQTSTLERARNLGWHLFKTPSAPLGLKLNTATRALGAAEFACDATHVMTFGSDDLIHPTAFWKLCIAGQQHPAVGFVGVYFLCARSWRAAHFNHVLEMPEAEEVDLGTLTMRERILHQSRHAAQSRRVVTRPSGAGRLLQRWVLDALNWAPRSDDVEQGMDASMDECLRSIGASWHILDHKTFSAPVLDVKTPRNLSSFDYLLKVGAVEVASDDVCAAFGARWIDRLRALRAEPPRALPSQPTATAPTSPS